MAKVKPIVIGAKEGVKLVSDNLEKKIAETKKEVIEPITSEVNIVKSQEPKVAVERMVKIKLKEDHRCHIGGEWYYFIKGKQYNVSENVKSILIKANKLIPL